MGKYGKKNHVSLNPLDYNIMLLGESKIGKLQPNSEPVLTEHGWMPMGELYEGIRVYGEDGELHTVTEIFPQGVMDIYNVTFRDGTSTRCGLEHLWTVSTKKQRENMRKHGDYRYKVLTLREIMKDYRTEKEGLDGRYSYKYSVPIAKPMNFNNNENLEIDPYILGLLIGDGGICNRTITFTNSEEDIIDSFKEYVKSVGQDYMERPYENHKQIVVNYGNLERNYIRDCLGKIGLYGCRSREKFIPVKYLYNSIENRRKLLSGLINTDGSVNGTRIDFDTYSYCLANDVAELARSLGFCANIKEYDRTNENSTDKYESEIEYIVSIIGEDYSCLNLSEKHKNNLVKKEIEYVKSITNIEYVGAEESRCIMVDNPNHLYITKDYIVTHNTTVVKKFCEKLVAEEGYMFLECGGERGADAIEGINYVNVPMWYGGNLSDEELERMEQNNEACMQDIIDDIVENKTTDYPDLKVVIVDTYDQFINIAEKESVRLWNKAQRESGHSEKCADTINGAWGGFTKGDKKAMDIMDNMAYELAKVGVTVFYIGHVKNKEITDVVSGDTYTTLTSDQQQNYFNHIKKNMHFIGLAYIDREIVKEKTGKKDNKGKDITVNKVAGEARKIKFRDDNYAVDSGSRFADIVPEIPLDADAMIKAIKDAILSEQKKSGMSLEDSKKEQIEKERKIQKQIEKNEQVGKERKEIEKIKDSIVNFCTAHKNDIDMIKPILVKCKELGYNNPKEIDNIKDALEVQRLTALTAE